MHVTYSTLYSDVKYLFRDKTNVILFAPFDYWKVLQRHSLITRTVVSEKGVKEVYGEVSWCVAGVSAAGPAEERSQKHPAAGLMSATD